MYYPCSENKGADQLRSNCEADLGLCFCIHKHPVFSRCSSNLHDFETLAVKKKHYLTNK